jgi:hypothetical protein
MCGVLLTYLVCEQEVPTAKDQVQNYNDINEDIAATRNHGALGFRAANTNLYDMIKFLIIDSSCWSYVQLIVSKRDGHLAYLNPTPLTHANHSDTIKVDVGDAVFNKYICEKGY